MRDQVTHQYVQDIVVDFHYYSSYQYSIENRIAKRNTVAYSDRMIKAVKFVSIPVRDQSKALEFYTKKLGFQILTDQPFGAQRWIELLIPGADTGVVLFTSPGQEDRIGTFSNIAFWSDDVQ